MRKINCEEIDHWFVNGVRVAVRALRPTDRDLEIEFLESLSERSRYLRLMTPLRHLPADLLTLLLDVDGRRRAALVAIIDANGRERCIGVARYAQTDNAATAELGITVTDEWQHRGVASRLIALLIMHAQRQGITALVGQVLPENHAMLALARKLGFSLHFDIATKLVCIRVETGRALGVESVHPA